MATLYLVEGPAGAGKSQVTAEMLDAGEVEVVADVTALWVALSGAVRGPDGRYPVRLADDPALHVARYLQAVAVRRSLEARVSVAVTTSSPGQVERWRRLADEAAAAMRTRTVSIAEGVARIRLADADGVLSDECEEAIARWFA